MAQKKKGTDSPSASTGEGEGFPIRQPRGGHRVHHDRILTAAERREREQNRARARKAEVEEEEKDRTGRKPKGWAGRRRER